MYFFLIDPYIRSVSIYITLTTCCCLIVLCLYVELSSFNRQGDAILHIAFVIAQDNDDMCFLIAD